MVAASQERILLIADHDQQIAPALAQVAPEAQVTAVPSIFDGVAELSGGTFTTIFAAAAPIERRPEAAVRTLRELAGDGRLLLFGHPTLEPLTRKMLDFGADDYLVTPITPADLQQTLGQAHMRLAASEPPGNGDTPPSPATSNLSRLLNLPLAQILLDALAQYPLEARTRAVLEINERIAPALRLHHLTNGHPDPSVPEGFHALSHPLRSGKQASGSLILHVPQSEDPDAARLILGDLAGLFTKLGSVQDTHRVLQKLVMTDELTGLHNHRYFKHFLAKICQRAMSHKFSVTLLLFDIDNFKQYNDEFGHGVGNEILRQTALVMRECCREHDVVARIGGDEFAVVFWDKEGPRQPREPRDPKPQPPVRPPQTPEQVFERFRRRIASPEFQQLGASGKGTLTISGGMAAYPWEARTPEELTELADKRMMLGAKKCGKDALFLVGGETPPVPPRE